MALFARKKDPEPESSEVTAEPPAEAPPVTPDNSGDMKSVGVLSADIEKVKAQLASFYEMQKASNERFTRINEQIGELRSMILERDRANQKLEAKATQAVDLVNSVQPDKLMIDIRKSDSRVEALRATIESNETVMQNIVSELKDMRNRINTFKGMEQVVKLSEDTKKDLVSIKQVTATVERHADRVETMFSEVQRSLGEFNRYNDVTQNIDKSFKQVSTEFESIKAKVPTFASKKEVETLLGKFTDFENKAGNVLDTMNTRFDDMQRENDKTLRVKLEQLDQLLRGFQLLAEKTPDLDKYFNLLSEEAKKNAVKEPVEKIKQPGEKPEPLPATPPPKPGIVGKVKSIVPGNK